MCMNQDTLGVMPIVGPCKLPASLALWLPLRAWADMFRLAAMADAQSLMYPLKCAESQTWT